jgi:DNA-binding NtrC family response regulator
MQAQQPPPVAQAATRPAKAVDASDGTSALAAAGSAGASALERLVGDSEPMRLVKSRIAKVARGMAPVLVRGESGTGKELVARAVHACSQRSDGPFVAVNCGAIPENLLEAEFFGARKGSYTGSAQDRDGYFQAARGGTLFLDEIGEMPLGMQAKLLRVLQQREVLPVGANEPEPVDVQVVAATNRDLEKEVEKGTFREDLYYRLNMIELRVPSLRERAEDIPSYIEFFSMKFADRYRLPKWSPSAEALAEFCSFEWPGNVRQLRNVVERTVIMAPREKLAKIEADMLPPEIFNSRGGADTGVTVMMSAPLREARESFEREYLRVQIRRFSGNISKTAAFIGMERSALHRKLKSLGVAGQRADEEDA